jgi:hypothetical protein
MAKRHGRNGRVLLNGVVLSAVSWTLDRTTDKVDVSGFGDNNKIYVIGKQDLTGTISGFWDDANDAIFDAADAGSPVSLYLYPDAVNSATLFWAGDAYVDASVNADSNGAVGFSGSFSAAGNWSRGGVA